MRGVRICAATAATVIWLAVLANGQRLGIAWAAEDVDVALVVAADVSRSINDDEFLLQRQGYAAALTSPRLLDAIRSGVHGAIAVTFVEWAAAGEQKAVIDWTVIRDEADARKFAATLLTAPRSYTGRTAIGSAIDFAAGLLGESGFEADRHLIDVSGDGTNNQGRPVTDARDAALKAGVVINGLAILQSPRCPGGELSRAAHQPARRSPQILPRQRDRRSRLVRSVDRRFQQLRRGHDPQAGRRDCRGDAARLTIRTRTGGRDCSHRRDFEVAKKRQNLVADLWQHGGP